MRRSLAVALALAAGACASARTRPLLAAGGIQRMQAFSVELPAGWMRSEGEQALMATRDGFSLQSLRGQCWKLDEPDLLPEELAERSANVLGWSVNAVVTSVRPVKLAGQEGFRLELSFRGADGLTYRQVAVGARFDDRECVVDYYAPARHYFERDLPAFERAVETFAPSGR